MKKLAIATAVAIGLAALVVGPAAGANAASGGYAIVKGTIVKETGNPLANTKVTVGVGDCETPGGCGADSVVTVKTDSGGHYHARVLVTSNPNVNVGVAATGPYKSRASAYIEIASGKTYTKNLTVYKEATIVGKIVDQSGNPVTAVIHAFDAKTNRDASYDVTKAGTGGYFHLKLTGGSYKLKIYVDTNNSEKGGVVTSWYGAKTRDDATVLTVKAGPEERAKIVFIP